MTEPELINAIAVHEAGHAVACVRFNIPFEFAELVCDERGWSGGVQPKRDEAQRIGEAAGRSRDANTRFDHQSMVYCAGGVANEIFCPYMTPDEMAHATSQDIAVARLFLECNSTLRVEDYEAYLIGIQENTRQWMQQPDVQRQVEAVAAALRQAKRLDARQVAAICSAQLSIPPELMALRVRVLSPFEVSPATAHSQKWLNTDN